MRTLIIIFFLAIAPFSYAQKHDMYLDNLFVGVGGIPGAPQTHDSYNDGLNIKLGFAYYLTKLNMYVGLSFDYHGMENNQDMLTGPDDYRDYRMRTPSLLLGRKLWVGEHLRFFPMVKAGYSFTGYYGKDMDDDARLEESGVSITPELYMHFFPGHKLGIGVYGSMMTVFNQTALNNPDGNKTMIFPTAGLSLLLAMNWF